MHERERPDGRYGFLRCRVRIVARSGSSSGSHGEMLRRRRGVVKSGLFGSPPSSDTGLVSDPSLESNEAARTRHDEGIVSASAGAVFMLMTNSNVVGHKGSELLIHELRHSPVASLREM